MKTCKTRKTVMALFLMGIMGISELLNGPVSAYATTGDLLIDEDETVSEETKYIEEELLSDDRVTPENDHEEIYYEAIEPDDAEEITADGASGIQMAEGVSEEMCSSDYWNDKTIESKLSSDEELISTGEITALNKAMLEAEDTNMNDLEGLAEGYDADRLRHNLVSATTTAKSRIFADNIEVVPASYYKQVADAIEKTAYTGNRNNQYAVAVKRTTINTIPVNAYIGYSADDPDDEKVNSALLVGEPFVVRQKATVFGDVFYWGYSDNCTGWVAAEDLAVCSDKDEWLESWKVDPSSDDFIVVTQNQIRLEPSVSKPELSEVKLTFATILKTVPEDKIPKSLGERGPWNNYVVYLPIRDGDGKYVRAIALISQHYEVSKGFLKMTQAEILRVAFNNLGDRYGWGGMLDSMDCSYYTKNVYRCFGLQIPRNTTWQQAIPGRKIDLSNMSDDEKVGAMTRMPAGTLFYMPGHTMIYTGTTVMDGRKMAYVISDTGSLSDSTGELSVRNMYSVILNPLSVRRRNESTWLSNITAAVLPISQGSFDFVKKNMETVTPIEPVSMNRVPAAEGQAYASGKDTLPLETFLGNTQNIFISFCNVEGSEVEKLTATVIKGSRITTKAPVKAVSYDKGVAEWKRSKSTGLATITLKKSGTVTFEMADGKTFDVLFTVESPKAETKAVNSLLKKAKEGSSGMTELSLQDLFGTQIDNGSLSITYIKKKDKASVFRNVLLIDPKTKNTVKVRYTYLNKKYTMTLTVK